MQRQKANPHMLPNGFYYQAKALSAQKSLDLFYYLRDSLTWQQPKHDRVWENEPHSTYAMFYC
jgi:hypothetical protein